MVRQGFVIFVPYANQRFADVRRMLFDRRDRCIPCDLDSVANSAVFPRNWASFTPVPRKGELQLRVAVIIIFLVLHNVRVTIKSHILLQLATQLSTNKGNSRAPG